MSSTLDITLKEEQYDFFIDGNCIDFIVKEQNSINIILEGGSGGSGYSRNETYTKAEVHTIFGSGTRDFVMDVDNIFL